MNETVTILALLDEVTAVILGNRNIWIPVLGAWMVGFIYTRWMHAQQLRRKTDRELRVYIVNGVIAFFLYIAFNHKSGIDVYLSQATLAAAVSVLLPAFWFWWQRKKQ